MSKKKDERQTQIRNILLQEGRIKIVDLAKLLKVTPETLRNDLNEMEVDPFDLLIKTLLKSLQYN